ncbi:MAG: hypothetical protein ACLFPE_02830 [Bacteroidales bacterium]
MYKHVDSNSEHFKGLEEFGKEMVVEILQMIPENYEKYTTEIRNGLANYDYDAIQRGVHSIKSDFRHLINVQSPVITFLQDFENRARDKKNEFKETGSVEEYVNFSADFEKLREMTEPALEEIIRFTDSYLKNH